LLLFNSIDFAIFLPIVFILYWFILNKNIRIQNLLIVVSSYLFYGWWDWRFLILIAFSSAVDCTLGILLGKENAPFKRKFLLLLSILVNLGLLFFFKYYNFFSESFSQAFSFLGGSVSIRSLNIILPVGISFYTFQTMSYTIDIYRMKLEPTKDILSFFAFVSFFPQLVAGPIERASDLLPQFSKKRLFEYSNATSGLKQILWGAFKKIVIADNCALYVNMIFDNYAKYNGSALIIGAFLFSFQIYGDFSGYSDIAIGVSKLFGFELKRNFSLPYFSRDIAEFWRRWHISLSSWFRDYVYFPLGGSKRGKLVNVRNIFIVFIVSGFWHGANWTFIVWGLVNALLFLPLLLNKKNRINLEVVAKGKIFPSLQEFMSIICTFFLTTLTWVFFRSENLKQSLDYFSKISSPSVLNMPNLPNKILPVVLLIVFLLIVEWIGREDDHSICKIKFKSQYLRWAFYSFVMLLILMYAPITQNQFIYFQF
jgi:alginate O-acetyltransferase complex protein AlgI